MAQWVRLTCHPGTPSNAMRRLEASAGPRSQGFSVTFRLHGDLDRLRIPPTDAPRRRDRLWEHTCFEAFAARTGTPAYHEFNCAPSRAWATYRFRAYRERMPAANALPPPDIRVRRAATWLELSAVLHLEDPPPALAAAPLRLALAAVIEDAHGARSYWALHHPPGRPDFHHPDAFVLTLAAPGMDSNGDTD